MLVLPENYKHVELLWHDITHLDLYNIQDDVFNKYVLVHFFSVEGKNVNNSKKQDLAFANFYCVKK